MKQCSARRLRAHEPPARTGGAPANDDTCIEEQDVAKKVLVHLGLPAEPLPMARAQAPPVTLAQCPVPTDDECVDGVAASRDPDPDLNSPSRAPRWPDRGDGQIASVQKPAPFPPPADTS